MKRTLILLLAVLMCLSLCACGKSEAVKNTEALIAAIGEVTLDSEPAIMAAEEAYAALTPEEQEKVENYETLVTAASELHTLQVKQTYIGTWYTWTFFYDNYVGDPWVVTEENYGTVWSIGKNDELILNEYEYTITEYQGIEYLCYEGIRCFVRAEDASYTEIEITIDNWQDYFTIEKRWDAEYNAFGDLEAYTILRDIVLKEEYKYRIVPRGTITFEFSGQHGWEWSFWSEEEQAVYAYTTEGSMSNETTYITQEVYGDYYYRAFHQPDLYGFPQTCLIARASTYGDKMEYDGRELWKLDYFVYPGDVSRVIGTLYLFDNPLYFEN